MVSVAFKVNITVAEPKWSVKLGHFHVEWLVFGLVTLEEGIGEIHLSGFPAMSGRQQHSGSDCGPSNHWTVGGAVKLHQISSAAPARFHLAESSTRQSLDPVGPSAWNGLHAWWD